MLAPFSELYEYTGCTQAAAVIRRFRALGCHAANKTAAGRPAVPNDWWQAFKMGNLPRPLQPAIQATTQPAANDSPSGNTLRLDQLPQPRGRKHGP